jgi:phospholipase C
MAGGYADRCGPGPRQPLVVISPYAKKNFVDHTQTDQASILRFIEDNWHTGQIGDASADATAGSVSAMFNFDKERNDKVLLNEQTGAVASITNSGNNEDSDDDGPNTAGK